MSIYLGLKVPGSYVEKVPNAKELKGKGQCCRVASIIYQEIPSNWFTGPAVAALVHRLS